MKNRVACTINHGLVLTPTLTQAINLLQLSHNELLETIEEQLDRNPMLSLLKPSSIADTPLEALQFIPDRKGDALKNALYEQVLDLHFDEPLFSKACDLIEELGEQGFIEASFFDTCSIQERNALIYWLRQLEPKGIGASGLREALLWQIYDHPLLQNHPARTLWIEFLNSSLKAPYDIDCYKKTKNLTANQWNQFKNLSEYLCFNPAGAYISFDSQTIVQPPDLIVIYHEGRYEVVLNEEIMPQLELDPASRYVTDQRPLKTLIQEAKSFIKIVRTRFDTLLSVARYIVDYQQDYFVQGPIGLKRLILEDIAEAIGLHESTVSRIINQKLIQTPFGVKELRSLLSRSLKKYSGEDVSTARVKKIIHQLVCHENGKKPLSDQKITDILIRQGFCIARRTVTKYRMQIELESSIKRKTL